MESAKNPRFKALVSSGRPRRLSNFLPGLLNGCLDFARALLPQSCHLCGADSAGAPLCSPCLEDLPWLPRDRCAVCALPLPSGSICGACLDRPPRFDRVEALFAYRYPVDALIHAFKYGGRLALARVLGGLVARAVGRDVDAIVPMPLAHGRLAERGFNQALEIARVAAAGTSVRLLPDACRKVADTPPQATLPWKERARNVRRAFACDADLNGMRVAVVDDVLTTGATLNELARVLRRAGAAEVRGWVVARTLPR
ncbi:MAG: ComF family protein [Betaproteobacteria bacterium]|nr:ComF family protein [Betaproteobacteria bacterium]